MSYKKLNRFLVILFLGCVATASAASEIVSLKCEPVPKISDIYEVWEVDFSSRTIRVTSFSSSGSRSQTYFNLQEERDDIFAFGQRENGEPESIRVNRSTGYARNDMHIADDEKSQIWDEERQKLGVPLDEDLWLGSNYQCAAISRMF